MRFEGGLCSPRLLVDDLAIRVAEDLRTCCNEEDPYRNWHEPINISMRQQLRVNWTYSR